MNKIFIFAILGLFLVGCSSAYMCVDNTQDTPAVIDFKNKVNMIALNSDITDHNLTEEAFYVKIKYFHPCN